MTIHNCKSPVALIIFKRPDTTQEVFNAIRAVKPEKLLVIADGARLDHLGEEEKCIATQAIIDQVDWDCKVFKNYSEINLGLKLRMSTGLDWVFSLVEEAIILEDDCVPDPTFFRFCDELLAKYRDDERIMMISGNNQLGEWKSILQSYHFSYYGAIWGWASWRRAWKHFDIHMQLWDKLEVQERIMDIISDPIQFECRKELLDLAYNDKVEAWSYAWWFARLLNSGLSVIPSINLVRNIGFSEDATNTQNTNDNNSKITVYSMSFPLREPLGLGVDRSFDTAWFQHRHGRIIKEKQEKKLQKHIKNIVKKLDRLNIIKKAYHFSKNHVQLLRTYITI